MCNYSVISILSEISDQGILGNMIISAHKMMYPLFKLAAAIFCLIKAKKIDSSVYSVNYATELNALF